MTHNSMHSDAHLSVDSPIYLVALRSPYMAAARSWLAFIIRDAAMQQLRAGGAARMRALYRAANGALTVGEPLSLFVRFLCSPRHSYSAGVRVFILWL